MPSLSQRIIRVPKKPKLTNALLNKYTEIGFRHGSFCRKRNWVVDIRPRQRLPSTVKEGKGKAKAKAKVKERKVQARE
jgi:hypothetical protein